MVDSSLIHHAPFAADDERCASVYPGRDQWSEKSAPALSLGAVAAGERNGEARRLPATALPSTPQHRRGGPVRRLSVTIQAKVFTGDSLRLPTLPARSASQRRASGPEGGVPCLRSTPPDSPATAQQDHSGSPCCWP